MNNKKNPHKIKSPVKHTGGREYLKVLLSRMPSGYKPTEVDWGKPVGKEIW